MSLATIILVEVLAIGASIGLAFGGCEAIERKRRIAKGDNRTLPHAKLLVWRIISCVFMAIVLIGGFHIVQPDPLLTPIMALRVALGMFLTLTIMHRFVFNVASGQPWYYMGSHVRTDDDSLYDDLMWTIACVVFVITKRWHDALPILFALTIELTVLYFTLKPLL